MERAAAWQRPTEAEGGDGDAGGGAGGGDADFAAGNDIGVSNLSFEDPDASFH